MGFSARHLALLAAVAAVGCTAFGADKGGTNGSSGSGSSTDYRSLVLTDAPRGYWRLGEASGELVAKDESGNGADGTYVGLFDQGVPGAIPGDGNTALRLNGKGQVKIADKVGWTGNAAYTIEAWVAIAAYHEGHIFSGSQANLFFWSDGRWNLRADRPGACLYYFDQGVGVADDKWHHLAVTHDTVTTRLYIDGKAVFDCVGNAALAPTSPAAVLGGWSDNNTLQGRIDEVAIYDKALAPPRIQAHFAAGH